MARRSEMHKREIVLVVHHIVVGRTTRPEQASVGLQVEVELCGMCNHSVDNGTSWAVSTPVSVTFILREEADMMPFST